VSARVPDEYDNASERADESTSYERNRDALSDGNRHREYGEDPDPEGTERVRDAVAHPVGFPPEQHEDARGHERAGDESNRNPDQNGKLDVGEQELRNRDEDDEKRRDARSDRIPSVRSCIPETSIDKAIDLPSVFDHSQHLIESDNGRLFRVSRRTEVVVDIEPPLDVDRCVGLRPLANRALDSITVIELDEDDIPLG